MQKAPSEIINHQCFWMSLNDVQREKQPARASSQAHKYNEFPVTCHLKHIRRSTIIVAGVYWFVTIVDTLSEVTP